jgi:hypothetical protein
LSARRRGRDTISFLSDYGTDDEFVGVVKSVLRQLAGEVVVIDLTHQVAPHDVRGGALTLQRAAPFLAPGVVLAVVDPGVGTSRRAVALEVGPDPRWALIGPDNGLLVPAFEALGGPGRAVSLANRRRHPGAGATFDGRDLFAPAAAQLCGGADLADLGPEIDPASLVPGPRPAPLPEGTGLATEILWIDRFGNAQLAARPEDVADLGDPVRLVVGSDERVERVARRAMAFADLGPGEVGLVVDSWGMIAVVLDRRSAADELGLTAGDRVVLHRTDSDGGRSQA